MFVASTEFSIGNSLLSIDDVVSTVEANSLNKVAVTDTMSVTAMIPLAEKLKDKLALGVRITLVEETLKERQPIYQVKIYPKNEKAMKVIYRYLSKSFERPNFYEQPRLSMHDFSMMLAEASDSFFVSTGDINNIFNYPKYKNWLGEWATIIGWENFIYDIVPIESAKFDRLNKLCLEHYQASVNAGCSPKTSIYIPALYTEKTREAFPIHYSIHKNVEFNFLNPYFKKFYYDKNELFNQTKAMIARLGKRYSITSFPKLNNFDYEGTYEWKKQEAKLPKLSADSAKTLRELAINGFKEKLLKSDFGFRPSIEDIKTQYKDRLEYELDIITKLNFSDYFLLVHELTSWCKLQKISVGTGRGSVGGSLVAYCLGITSVDPIRFGLMFERFINPTRLDLPDIDLDFVSSRRHEIIEHLTDRYGSNNVSGIINYAFLQSKSALRSTCRIMGLAENEYSCSKLIPSNFGFTTPLKEAVEKVNDIDVFSKKYPKHWNTALLLEGKLRNFSTHAAGVIVSPEPLVNDAVVEIRSDTRIINWDKKICEKQGLIKLDILGLTTLDIIDLALKYISEIKKVDININDIPLDDEKTLAYFGQGLTAGVFQFEGGSVRKLLKSLSNSAMLHFDDLVAANALNRPGPIEAGLVSMYVDGKNGSIHPIQHSSMSDILSETYNVMVYQEQIMKVAVEFAGYTLPEADNLRKIMGKKLPEEMKKEASKFITGAVDKHGVANSLAENIFDQISKFAFYAFNKSHSVAYSLLSYICMYLKVYYPSEFYSATLSFADDKKVRSIINEANKVGIKVLPPNINYSTDKFFPKDEKNIVAPLSKIKFVAAATMDIIEARETGGPFKSIEDLYERTTRRLVNVRVVCSMDAVGALDDLFDPAVIAASVDPAERSKAIYELMPSIPLGTVIVSSSMKLDTAKITKIEEHYYDNYSSEGLHIKPWFDKPKFMAVFDCASDAEEKSGFFTEVKSFKTIQSSLRKNGLSRSDGYWTGLFKRKKRAGEKIFSNKDLADAFDLLKEEIKILNPPLIVCFGSNISKMFDPAAKGGVIENAGKIIYSEELDCNVLFAFNTSQIYFNPEYEHILDDICESISDII